MRLMAHGYMAIPASSCLAECSFSISARTDDPWHHQIGAEKFSALQRLHGAYHNSQLKAFNEAWHEIDPNIIFNNTTDQ